MLAMIATAANLCLLACLATTPAPDADAMFAEALARFRDAQQFQRDNPTQPDEAKQRFHDAAAAFEHIYDTGAVSTQLLTNIANAHYFAGDTPKAVLYYRRASLADPGNRVAQSSLAAVRQSLPIRKPHRGPATSLMQSMMFWHHGTSFMTRKALLTVVAPAFWLCLTVSLWRHRPFRTIALLLAIVATPLAASVALDAFGRAAEAQAVVMTETQGRRGDHPSYSPSHSQAFPPGTELTVLERRSTAGSGWIRSRLLDGSETWLPADRVAFVAP